MAIATLSARRRAWGYGTAVLAPLLAVPVLISLRGTLNLASDVAVYLVLVVMAALVGGLGPALVAAGLGAGLLNFYFTRPFHTFAIDDPNNVVALVAFVLVAGLVSWVVDVAERRSAKAAAAAELEAADRLRTALLAAVGHDLRTPLATAKAVVSGLRAGDVEITVSDREELLETADGALDRLAGLVDNLLDMSRLQAGAMPVHMRPVAVEDVLSRALDDLGVADHSVLLDVDENLPAVLTDPGLLERVVVNLVANAQRFSPEGVPPVVGAARDGDRLVLSVVDRGPGIPAYARHRVFQPFQRLGDTDPGTGIGLGLALARGLVEAMDGTLTPLETPGGGLTMRVSLPAEVEP
jgi:two-component system, OmpR family, sensor histidine kinase KdpD